MWLTAPEDVSAFAEAVWPLRSAINNWCQSRISGQTLTTA
jgi:hypothetical protein